ncbi:unnamed protein product [Psylliodes chrysocephalus]|uniref:Uncharacterized protein n=1 Tax=Psylliodes chrysocephalus TaxID=3402493 RepID=A0A9P0GCQ3_9CUCU|nr:unnamed protein product [Psylliodes chrysocephala]
MVLDILEKESPVIVSLGVPESLDDAEPLPQDSISIEQPTLLTQDPGVPSTSCIGEKKSDDKNKEKLDLQNEYLKLQNYKTKLEILELKTALHLPKSKFTQCFAVRDISYGQDQHTTYKNL